MQLHPIAIALAVTAALAVFAANAQNVDTTPDWDGQLTITGFGGETSYGQTITAPAGHDRLASFSFYIDGKGLNSTFQASVHAWDAAQKRAVGNALWQSAPATAAGASGTLVEHVFTPAAGIPVVPGQTYVLLGTNLSPPGSGLLAWGYLNASTYGGGNFIYTTDITGTVWDFGTNDLAFKATFAPAPPPPPPPIQAIPVPGPQGAALALLGLTMAGAGLRSIRPRRTGAPKP